MVGIKAFKMAVKYIKKVRKRTNTRPYSTTEKRSDVEKDEVLKLSKPLSTLSGDTVDELHFAFKKLTPKDYRQIVRLEARLKGDTPNFDINSMSKKTSSEFRMATAWIGAVRGTKGLCLDDIDNLALLDLLELEEMGCFFIAHLV